MTLCKKLVEAGKMEALPIVCECLVDTWWIKRKWPILINRELCLEHNVILEQEKSRRELIDALYDRIKYDDRYVKAENLIRAMNLIESQTGLSWDEIQELMEGE